MDGVIAVLDIGKTNVKLATFAGDGALVGSAPCPIACCRARPIRMRTSRQIWEFLLGRACGGQQGAHRIAAIVPTTHGCAAALIDDAGLVLPVMDYEFAGVEEIEPLYAPLRPPFSETFSPSLARGPEPRPATGVAEAALSRAVRAGEISARLSAILGMAACRRRGG